MRNEVTDLQPKAAGLLCYRLLDVVAIREEPQSEPTERRFFETKSPALLLSNAHGGRLVIDGRSHVLRPGSLFVCKPGCLIELTNYSGLSTELLLLEFYAFFPPDSDAAHQDDASAPMKLPFPPFAQLPSASDAGRLFGTISAGWKTGLASDRIRCEAALLELLSLALSCREQQAERALEAARMELELRYTGDITIDALAGVAGLSRFHFMRLFKERYGKGVVEYRTELRLRDAKRLLNERDGPSLGEIAERIGYTSESYFSSLFKKQTGIAPAVYQRNQKRRIAAYSWVNVGQLLALRTIPYAAPTDQYWTDYYRYRYDFEVRAPLSHQYEFNRNVLLQSQPDKIVGVGSFIPQIEQDKLKEIAPTLFLDWEEDWRSHLRRVAAFLDRDGEAEQWLARYDRAVAAARDRLTKIVGRDTLLVLAVGGRGVEVCGRRAATLLYDDLGFAEPGGIRMQEIAWSKAIDPQMLSQLHASRILVHRSRDPGSAQAWERLSRSEAWLGLPAVMSGKVHWTSDSDHFEAPLNEYAAEPLGRLLGAVPRWFGGGQ
ncbi:ABC-type Fe3+-hydroxamate transport system, substrate-binding protein [Cohnella sp. OV330]|uniref:helix-turn-helix domain-containing protein n=1 Tax=Cohnella sp. OV330 TaxID=1855288 RepID=UPI0008EE3658|nr:helix-turn-helix domain-containing protein [Cohnella sp. OV330]SFB57829.1 ABC-type Fe3+-hydroxamate transport system, substrate-binding protein [Cohnella sp. OV330]